MPDGRWLSCFQKDTCDSKLKESRRAAERETGREGKRSLKAYGIHRRAEHQNKVSFKRAKETLDGC